MVTYPSDWKTNKIIEVADIFDNLRIPVTKNQRKPGNTCTIVKQVDTNSANLLSSRSRRYLAVIGSLSFIGRQVA